MARLVHGQKVIVTESSEVVAFRPGAVDLKRMLASAAE
jgi:hypothetical protein